MDAVHRACTTAACVPLPPRSQLPSPCLNSGVPLLGKMCAAAAARARHRHMRALGARPRTWHEPGATHSIHTGGAHSHPPSRTSDAVLRSAGQCNLGSRRTTRSGTKSLSSRRSGSPPPLSAPSSSPPAPPAAAGAAGASSICKGGGGGGNAAWAARACAARHTHTHHRHRHRPPLSALTLKGKLTDPSVVLLAVSTHACAVGRSIGPATPRSQGYCSP
jgi:hypothetical protein